jgi:hypothetical protein
VLTNLPGLFYAPILCSVCFFPPLLAQFKLSSLDKHEVVLYTPMTALQRSVYKSILEKDRTVMKDTSLSSIIMRQWYFVSSSFPLSLLSHCSLCVSISLLLQMEIVLKAELLHRIFP